MSKSPEAFRTISEVAEWLDTPAHVLRFWESRFTQVKPVKRAGGRRYYRPNDMLLLGGIKKLLHEDGMTIKGAQKMLRSEGVKKISTLSQSLDKSDDAAVESGNVLILETPVPETAKTVLEPEIGIPEPELELEPEPATEPEPEIAAAVAPPPAVESPLPLSIETPADPDDDANFGTPANIAAQLRQTDPGALKNNPDLAAIFNRLQTLHSRLKATIDTEQPG